MTTPKADLLQGTLDLLILKALSLGPLHGYGVIQRIRQMSGEMLFVEQGAYAPALYRIEQRAWVSSKWGVNETGRRAKFYRLTSVGRKQLSVEEESWDLLALAIAKVRQSTEAMAMTWLGTLGARVRSFLRREATLDDIEQEMRSHVELMTEANIARGMDPDAATLRSGRSAT